MEEHRVLSGCQSAKSPPSSTAVVGMRGFLTSHFLLFLSLVKLCAAAAGRGTSTRDNQTVDESQVMVSTWTSVVRVGSSGWLVKPGGEEKQQMREKCFGELALSSRRT